MVLLGCILLSWAGPLGAGQVQIAAYSTTLSGEVLTSVEVRFDEAVDLASLKLVGGNGNVIPHYFWAEWGPGYTGTLYWMFHEVPMFHIEKYTLHYDSGEWVLVRRAISNTPRADEEPFRFEISGAASAP